jgi:anti-sigma regulatory factor (Ser/Thr protein kinase)
MIWHENQVRPGGRHRRGEPLTEVRPRRWDAVNRERARRIDETEPSWTVWYGVGTRRFHAVAGRPDFPVVQARTAEELDDLMREAERTGPARPLPAPVPSALRGAPVMPETPNGPRIACWDLPHDPSTVGKVRHLANETLTRWGLRNLADDMVLVIGELLANAIVYGEPPVRLSLRAGAGELCVRVTDHGPDRPRHLDLGVEAVHGRGLTIVEALADDSGVVPFPDGPGKTVWARWRLPVQDAEVAHTARATAPAVPAHPE